MVRPALPLALLSALAWAPSGYAAAQDSGQAAALSSADSTALVEEAHKHQKDFEQLRASMIPLSPMPAGRCEDMIGRICMWWGGEQEGDVPPEFQQVVDGRTDLIEFLTHANEQIHDPWITGQLVRYLVQDGESLQAERVARGCALTERWWCEALLGYVLHIRGSFVDAETAYQAALDSMPPKELERWTTPGYLLQKDGKKVFEQDTPEERAKLWKLFWRLSDPLYLVPGNDRLTEHYTRLVQVRMDEDAANPQGIDWGDDMAEALIRYGRMTGYSRSRARPPGMQGGRLDMRDTRQVIGHNALGSRGFLFPEQFLKAPAEIPPESWITAPRVAWTWYAPPYAPHFAELETQVARFRRGDTMLVVGAYKPGPLTPAERVEPEDKKPEPEFGRRGGIMNPFDHSRQSRESPPRDTTPPPVKIVGPVETGFYLVPTEGGPAIDVRGSAPSGVLTLKAPQGRYVSSLEVFDQQGKQAWRARQGVVQDSLVPGVPAVSDLMILKRSASLPTSLAQAIPEARPGIRIEQGQRFIVVWEVYGLRVQEPVGVTLGFTRGRPGFLGRVGKFMGILKPSQPVNVTFQDTGPTTVQTAFRAVQIQLPKLDPGQYTLHLQLDLRGRSPIVTSRPIVVVK
jgi:hypothetical protein